MIKLIFNLMTPIELLKHLLVMFVLRSLIFQSYLTPKQYANPQKILHNKMQKQLQQFDNTFLKKQTSKLSLQIKLSLINSQYYEKTISQSPKYSYTLTTKNSLSVKPFDTTERSKPTKTLEQILDDRLQKIQHELNQQFLIMQKQKQFLKERFTEYQNSHICRQKKIIQLNLKRKIQIQTLKRSIKLAIKCNVQQRQYFFHRLQSEFDLNVNLFIKKWKKVKKIWKSQLKNILEKFQGHQISISPQKESNNMTQKTENIQVRNSLKSLLKQLKVQLMQSQKESLKLQIKLSDLIQNYETKRQELSKKFSSNLSQILESVQNMQKSIKTQIKKEQLEREWNRQKLLLLFEEKVEKIQFQKQLQSMSKFKPPKLEYRHLKG